MPYLTEFLTVAFIHLLAVMSPGPDFVMITRNSLVYSRKAGIYSAFGLGLGILVHIAYSLVGIGLIISKSLILFSIIKFMGAGYLIYVGYKSLKAKSANLSSQEIKSQKEISPLSAIRIGFITNVTNPKATLFFFSLFTQVINPSTPIFIQLLYGAEMAIVTSIWFTIVALIFSNQVIKNKFSRFSHYIEKAMGAVLIGLGLKIAFSKST